MKIELTKPIRYKDTDIQTLDPDFESLTGRDLIDAEKALRAQGQTFSAWEFSRSYLAAIAARACGLPREVLEDMNVTDFTRITLEAAAFLGGQASAASTQTNSDD
ncbi:MAG: phage tail assembly protein [Synergistaceae bacterium]|nr:phage tail assembly protein [Synergistaceae bacterium]